MLDARRIFVWLAALAFLIALGSLHAQLHSAGYIDTAFGAPCLSNSLVNFTTRALAVQTNGSILVAGDFVSPQSCVNAIGRLRTNGAADATFASPFVGGDQVRALAVLPGGKILAGGNMRDGNGAFGVARLNANGALDNSFQRTVPGSAIVINALAVQPDNRIVAAGYDFLTVTGKFFGRVVRLNTNGAVDSTFVQGVTPASVSGQFISAVALQPDNKVLMGGVFTTYNDGTPMARDGLVRLNANGTVDIPFNPLISNSDIRALLVQPDEKILVAGRFTVDGVVRMLMRLNPDGARDTSFTNWNSAGGSVGLSLALQPDGKVLFGQSFGVARLTTNGAIDTTFGPRNDAISIGTAADSATALARTSDGHVLVGAMSIFVNNTVRRSVARLFGDVPPAPIITKQPVTQNVEAGMNVSFSVVATGAPPIFYQWRKNGTPIKDQTNSMLLLTNVHSTDTANYVVVVSNAGGAVTSAVTRLLVSFHTGALTVLVDGAGTVKPNLDGRELEIGRTYTLTAKPAAGNIFSNWTGGVTSSAPVLNFVMESNLVLVANFVPSPFTPVKGVYNGLFFDTSSPAHANAGALVLTLDDKGRIRGTVRMGARTRRFVGTFSAERVANLAFAASAADPELSLTLQLDTATAVISGHASNATFHSTLTAYRNPFSTSASPAPNSGNYNAALPGAEDGALSPAGDGFAAIAVSTSGRASGKGTLADGTMFKLLSATADNAAMPVYAPLYGGRGSLFGWLSVTHSGANDVSGTLWWTKPSGVAGALYRNGFTNQIDVIGSRYISLGSGTPVLTLTNGAVILSGGNLVEPLTNSITLGGDNRIVGDNQLSIVFSAPKGSFSGSFVDPTDGKKRTVKGVALPNQQQGRGFFLGASQSGRVFIADQP